MGSKKRKERWPIRMLLTSYHHGQPGHSVWGALGPAKNTPCDYPPEACSGWNLSTILPAACVGRESPPAGRAACWPPRCTLERVRVVGVWMPRRSPSRARSVQVCSTRPSFTSVCEL